MKSKKINRTESTANTMATAPGIITLTNRLSRRRRKASPAAVADAAPATTKRALFVRRWFAAGALVLASGLIVLYVANSIAINNLMADITSLERERDLARNENEQLRADLLKLMAVERISNLAQQQLGMMQPAAPPVLLQEPSVVSQPANTQAAGNIANE